MCGIFSYLGVTIDSEKLRQEYMKTYGRGPDSNVMKQITHNLVFGFHRLSIMDISFRGDQPLYHPSKPYVLICNGEIYNYQELKEKYDIQTYSNSDCEVILYLYEKFGIEKTLQLLDSEAYAFCLYDGLQGKLIVSRDRFGVRPLFVSKLQNGEYMFCSEMKSLHEFIDVIKGDEIEQFQPGSYRIFSLKNEYSFWSHLSLVPSSLVENEKDSGYLYYYKKIYDVSKEYDEEVILRSIREKMTQAVRKRLMSDRPIGCLLSGGLDSSLISALVAREFKNTGKGQLETFAIGIKGATDLEYAKQVADFIGSKHHSIELEESDFLEAIPEVIKAIESYDTTTVRASTGNYLVGKYIKENTDITVVFNGDGSDEQSGYIYLSKAPDKESFHEECVKLLSEIHYFDVLRSDRSLSTDWSLETRSPFLDTDFVNYYMSIPTELKMYEDRIEKYLLRKAFDKENLLPHEVLWRRKEAFSDGCSSNQRSWHKIIQEHVDSKITDVEFLENKDKYTHNTPELKESYYYRKLFEEYYPNMSFLIPHFWLPKWNGNMKDPSARELTNY